MANNMLLNLANKVPETNERLAKQKKAANEILMQRAVGGAQVAPQANVSRVAQEAAPQAIQQQAAITQQQTAQTQQDLGRIAEAGIQQQGFNQQVQAQQAETAQREELAGAQRQQERTLAGETVASQKRITDEEVQTAERLQRYGIDQDNTLLNVDLETRQQLERIGRDVKEKLFDSRLRFQRDEAGRKFSNERQLADFTLMTAQNKQEFDMKMLKMRQEYKKEEVMTGMLRQKITEAIERGWLTQEQKLDHDMLRELKEIDAELKRREQKAKAKAANGMMIAQGLGTVAGAAIGAAVTAPAGGIGMGAGAAMGASIGGGLGSAAYGASQ